MTTRRFPFKRADGGISVIVPAPNSQRKEEDTEDWLKRVIGKALTNAIVHDGPVEALPECDCTELPNRRFRNAWKMDATTRKVRVGMTNARKIRMKEIRQRRNEKLDASDKLAARHIEADTGDKAEWITYKQALRDIPAGVDLEPIKNPEDLDAFEPIWPIQP